MFSFTLKFVICAHITVLNLTLRIRRNVFNQQEFIQLTDRSDSMQNGKHKIFRHQIKFELNIYSIRFRYDARADQWRDGPRMNKGRWGHALISDGARLLAIGGNW